MPPAVAGDLPAPNAGDSTETKADAKT
jgi:hypothetical protein